jgi:hypothetical protein
MSKFVLIATAAFLATIASVCAEEQVWTVDNWPADAAQIPCSAWTKAADGTWVLHGAVKLGADTVSNIGVKGDAAAHLLDRQCGAKK